MKYKNLTELKQLSPKQLLAEKKAMLQEMRVLLANAQLWKEAFKRIDIELKERVLYLEVELEIAGIDRMESSDADYGIVGFIH